MKKISLFVSIACVSFSMQAQQDPMFTHYMYNTLSVNPGYAGSREALTITGLHRSQWTNFKGAPTGSKQSAFSDGLQINVGILF